MLLNCFRCGVPDQTTQINRTSSSPNERPVNATAPTANNSSSTEDMDDESFGENVSPDAGLPQSRRRRNIENFDEISIAFMHSSDNLDGAEGRQINEFYELFHHGISEGKLPDQSR